MFLNYQLQILKKLQMKNDKNSSIHLKRKAMNILHTKLRNFKDMQEKD